MSESMTRQIVARYDFYVSFISRLPNSDNRDIDNRQLLQEIQQLAVEAINNNLTESISQELVSRFGNVLQPRIIVQRGSVIGSVILVLAAGVSFFDFASKYKDFHESLLLIRQQIRTTINRTTSRIVESSPYFYTVETDMFIYPVSSEKIRHSLYPTIGRGFQSMGFFWYLLLMNIFLLGIICLLVYSAVARMYFITP